MYCPSKVEQQVDAFSSSGIVHSQNNTGTSVRTCVKTIQHIEIVLQFRQTPFVTAPSRSIVCSPCTFGAQADVNHRVSKLKSCSNCCQIESWKFLLSKSPNLRSQAVVVHSVAASLCVCLCTMSESCVLHSIKATHVSKAGRGPRLVQVARLLVPRRLEVRRQRRHRRGRQVHGARPALPLRPVQLSENKHLTRISWRLLVRIHAQCPCCQETYVQAQ